MRNKRNTGEMMKDAKLVDAILETIVKHGEECISQSGLTKALRDMGWSFGGEFSIEDFAAENGFRVTCSRIAAHRKAGAKRGTWIYV